MSTTPSATAGAEPTRRPSRIEELREKIEAQSRPKPKRAKISKRQRGSFHENIFAKQDREKVVRLIKESEAKGKPRRKKKKPTGKKGAPGDAGARTGPVSSRKIGASARNLKESGKKAKASGRKLIKNSYLRKAGKDKTLVGTKGAKKVALMFKKKPKLDELSEIKVPQFKNISKMAKSLSPRNKKKIVRKAGKASRMSSPRRAAKRPKKSRRATPHGAGPTEAAEARPGEKPGAPGGAEEELNQLISESSQLHSQLEISLQKEGPPTPARNLKKSRSALGIRKPKSRTPNKRRLKNSSTIKNLNGRSASRKPRAKRSKSKLATRGGFETSKKGTSEDEIAFATEKKFMRVKNPRQARPKEEYESGIPLRPKGKPKTKLRLKKGKRRRKKKPAKASKSEAVHVSFDGDDESEFISEVQTRALVPGQMLSPAAGLGKDVEKVPETAATVKKKKEPAHKQSESPEEYLQSLVLEQPEAPGARESVSYKYFETDGKFSDGDEQAELKNSLFVDHYVRGHDSESEGLLSSKFLARPAQKELNAHRIFEQISQKKTPCEVGRALDEIQTFRESLEKDAEHDILKFIDSKKQSRVEAPGDTRKKGAGNAKVKILSQQNIDFEGLIQQKSGEKGPGQGEGHSQALPGDSEPDVGAARALAFSDLAKARARVISFKALQHPKLARSPEREQSPLLEEFAVMAASDRLVERISTKAANAFAKKFRPGSGASKAKGEGAKKPGGMLFRGGAISSQFSHFRGRSSVALSAAPGRAKPAKQSRLNAIEEIGKEKPWSVKDLVKRNTKQLVFRARLEAKQKWALETVGGKGGEESQSEAGQEEPVRADALGGTEGQLGEAFQRMNWAKRYLQRLGEKAASKMEFKKMDEQMDLIKSKIEITNNNIETDLQDLQDLLDKEEQSGGARTNGSRVDVSKYFSKDESIILEEKDEEYFTYEHSEDSMEDLRSIDFSKKESAQNDTNPEPGEPAQAEAEAKTHFDYSIQATNSVFIGKMNSNRRSGKGGAHEKRKAPLETAEKTGGEASTDRRKPEPKVTSAERKAKGKKQLPTFVSQKPKRQSGAMPIKSKKLKSARENPLFKRKALEKPVDLRSGRALKTEAKGAAKSGRGPKKSFQDSIRESRILKINTVTDFDLKQESSSDSDLDSNSDSEEGNFPWDRDFPQTDLKAESGRSSKPSRPDSDSFRQRGGDPQILRILHESQRMLEVLREEESSGAGQTSESEREKFQKSQMIYFKESDLKGLTERERRIRDRIKTSNRLIRHLTETQPDLEGLSCKDVREVKALIEEPFRYRSFDKLTENEKKERIDLELVYKQKVVEKINAIISTHSGRKQSELVTKEIDNLVSGRTLQRWKNIQRGELTAILKIQRFFRFKIEEKIGKKIMEMQKEYYKSRASIFNPPK